MEEIVRLVSKFNFHPILVFWKKEEEEDEEEEEEEK
jgi:hypothetical protein